MQRGKKENTKIQGKNTKGKEMPKPQRGSENNDIDTLAKQLREEKRKSLEERNHPATSGTEEGKGKIYCHI